MEAYANLALTATLAAWAPIAGGVELFAVGGLNAGNLETAVGANDREAVSVYGDDLAHLAGDTFGVPRRQRRGIENFYRRAVEPRPGAGRRIAAADQAIDLLPRPAPIDVRIVGTATAFIGRFRLVLFDPRRLAGFDEVDRLEHRLDPIGKSRSK